jgi:hypothetical protein
LQAGENREGRGSILTWKPTGTPPRVLPSCLLCPGFGVAKRWQSCVFSGRFPSRPVVPLAFFLRKFDAPAQDRTGDPPLRRRVLYPLSYGR